MSVTEVRQRHVERMATSVGRERQRLERVDVEVRRSRHRRRPYVTATDTARGGRSVCEKGGTG